MGPTLFTIYTIELSWILKKHNVTFKLYADDTQFYFSVTTIQSTMSKTEEVMTDIKNWMVKKRLKLNDDKTECMLFGTENTLKNYEVSCFTLFHFLRDTDWRKGTLCPFCVPIHNKKQKTKNKHIMIGTSNIKIVPLLRNLGVYIDSNLTMKNQISNTVKVCNHHLRNIAFIRKCLNEDALKMLIHNHVIARLDYCNSIYYRLPNILLKKLQNIQNKAARLIKKFPLRERITPALIELLWLPMKARIIYKICLFTYKTLKFGEPKYLNEYLVPFGLETSVAVRHANDRHRLFEPRTIRSIGERSFQYSAPRLSN